jgi:hypothetical protein
VLSAVNDCGMSGTARRRSAATTRRSGHERAGKCGNHDAEADGETGDRVFHDGGVDE